MRVIGSLRGPIRGTLSLTAAALLLGVACAPAASPTSAPAAPATSAPAPTAAAAKPTTAAAAPTTAPAAAPAATTAPAAAAKPTDAPKPAAPAATTAPAAPAPTAAGAAAAKTITLPKPEKTSVKLGYSALEAIMATYSMALELGTFKKYGLENVEMLYSEGDAKTLQSLISGGVDATAQGPTVSISSQLTDSQLVTVAMNSTVLTDDLFAISSVKSAADLKGKKVGISSFGGTSHMSTLLALKALGLGEQDVTIVQVGGEAARAAALQSGSVAAATTDIFRRPEMQQQGFNLLVSVAEQPGLKSIRNGLQFQKDFLQKNPNTVLALVAGLLDAQQQLYSQTDRAIDAYARFAQITDRANAEARLKALLPYMQRDLRWTPDAWVFARDVMATQNAALKDVDVTKAYTFQFLDQLKALGLNDAVGVPKS